MFFLECIISTFFLNGSPEASLGSANKTGWMITGFFPEVLKHIQKYTSDTKDNKILLLYDNTSHRLRT